MVREPVAVGDPDLAGRSRRVPGGTNTSDGSAPDQPMEMSPAGGCVVRFSWTPFWPNVVVARVGDGSGTGPHLAALSRLEPETPGRGVIDRVRLFAN